MNKNHKRSIVAELSRRMVDDKIGIGDFKNKILAVKKKLIENRFKKINKI